MDNANRTSTPEAVSAEDLAIAQEVDKAFRLYESTIQVARLRPALKKRTSLGQGSILGTTLPVLSFVIDCAQLERLQIRTGQPCA